MFNQYYIVDINNGLLCSGIWEEHLEGASTLIICGCLCGIRMKVFEMSLLTMYRVGWVNGNVSVMILFFLLYPMCVCICEGVYAVEVERPLL